ncbi:hypothetical protein ABZV58_22445 [Nocardia sp. NPDC004654]|uniref:hypothetical protein n=1 Tax=Nocardia sp. NPDC004654 TaxID=3154776 RepID=UPI0033A2BC30
MNLQQSLVGSGRLRWLDVGSGGEFAPNFHYLDIFPEGLVPSDLKSKYFRVDILNASDERLSRLGKFSLVRLQHTIEHFDFEAGVRVIVNCAKLLEPDGYLLVTAPDLKLYAEAYIAGKLQELPGFVEWAQNRIPKDAPASAYFSVFAHSMTYESHKWCYDYQGLEYLIASTGRFTNIHRLSLDSEESSVPFTHNRPDEDVCVLAQLGR